MTKGILDIDHGWKAIKRELLSNSKAFAKVGVLQSAAPEPSAPAVSLASIALQHEVGAGVPRRPFMSIAFERNRSQLQSLSKRILRRIAGGSLRVKRGIELLGEKHKNDIQRVIGNRGLLKANAPETVARKGSDAPLIDTGHLRQQINFEVKVNG